jgi:hypothetical protein
MRSVFGPGTLDCRLVRRLLAPAAGGAALQAVQAIEKFPEAVGDFGFGAEGRQGAQKALRRFGTELAPHLGGHFFGLFTLVAGHHLKNPVSASKLLQQGNGSPITPLWQAKSIDTVKFELKWKRLAVRCSAPADSRYSRLPLDFWPPNLDIGHKIHTIRNDGKRR